MLEYHICLNSKQRLTLFIDFFRMKIGIFGSSGFIGSHLKVALAANHEVFGFTRLDLSIDSGLLAAKLEGIDVIINLVGESILAHRWTPSYKKKILESRINALTSIQKALELTKLKPSMILSASAIGIYKPKIKSDEFSTKLENDFIADIVKKWEKAAFALKVLGPEVLVLRFGIVLKREGAALKEMISIFKRGVGVMMGPGSNVYPYISLNDLIRAVGFLIENKTSFGVYNLVAPVRTTNMEFSRALAKTLKTRIILPVPSWFFTIFLGHRAKVIMAGQHVIPKRLVDLGFHFEDSNIAEFLSKEINSK